MLAKPQKALPTSRPQFMSQLFMKQKKIRSSSQFLEEKNVIFKKGDDINPFYGNLGITTNSKYGNM
jgi:hypothetical protein